jgi:ABC-type nitrate/sulfonate/bicarbonate transport system substrate-binding protein
MTRAGLKHSLALLLLLAAPALAQDKPLTIEVGLGDVSLNKLMFVIAAETGTYKKNGLDVTQFITPGAAAVVRRSGIEVPKEFIRNTPGDINIGGGSPLMVAMTTNALATERVILATTDPVSRFHVISRPDITRPEDLKGKRIGYSVYGALSHFSAINFAKRMGWDPDRDISLIGNAMSVDVLKSGRVDALVGAETAWTMAIDAGFRDLGQYHFAMAGSGVNAAKPWLAKNREAAARFIKATVEAIALIKTDKQLAFAAMRKWYGITDAAHQESIYAEARKLASTPDPNVAGIKAVMATYTYHEMARHSPEDFYDASFIAELDKSGYIESLYKNAP